MAGFSKSYSQVAEDLLAAYYLQKSQDVTYVDVGCLWPVVHSNTYAFYEAGGYGICIDPNPTVEDEYTEIRPRDTFVNCGIGATETTLVYHTFENPVFNTFSVSRAQQLSATGKRGRSPTGTVEVPVRPLRSVLISENWRERVGPVFDFLSIDVEGFELEVVSSMDFDYSRPRLVVMETVVKEEQKKGAEARQLLLSRGYRLVGETGHDAFFMTN